MAKRTAMGTDRLTSAGLLPSARGNGGGYRLAGPASEITLREVVQAVDGPTWGELPADFAAGKDGHARRLAGVCEEAAAVVRGTVGQVRLSESVKG
jgi:DNA-binding IscR family transcriptional regulator